MIFRIAVAGAAFCWTESELGGTAGDAEAFICGKENIAHSLHGAPPTRCEHFVCLEAECMSVWPSLPSNCERSCRIDASESA
jgi:hypothetical protein